MVEKQMDEELDGVIYKCANYHSSRAFGCPSLLMGLGQSCLFCTLS